MTNPWMPSQKQIKAALDGLAKAERGNAIKLDHTIYNRHDWIDHHINTVHALLVASIRKDRYINPPCADHSEDSRCVMCCAMYVPTLEEIEQCYKEECETP